ncbi:proteasome assembly chaperone family protein [Saccharolobus shibatae]|uniref:proteasome assembly chaperone family protein n=1 Tax=Saccharolobus shibatae TaxID=2286 RepID=UPI001C482855|nr:proteasome assembly chaperone family protein [Saccharolobus shibatae]
MDELSEAFEVRERYVPQIGRPSYLLVSLPDAGLVGSISGEFLINSLNLKEYGEIYSHKYLPPISHVVNGVAKSPIRLYHYDNFLLLHSWVAIPANSIHHLADLVVDYAEKYGIQTIISITGVPVPNRLELEKPTPYWVVSSEDFAKELDSLNLMKKFVEGYVTGPYAPILFESAKKFIRNLVIVVESFLDLPDPEAAAVALDILSKMLGFKVDTSSLLKEAEEIRVRIKGLMQQTRQELPNYSGLRPYTYA